MNHKITALTIASVMILVVVSLLIYFRPYNVKSYQGDGTVTDTGL